METITITLTGPVYQKLKELAKEANLPPEELVRASVEEWLQHPNDEFARAARHVLKKNAELYSRMA
jgi:hypothetical protein